MSLEFSRPYLLLLLPAYALLVWLVDRRSRRAQRKLRHRVTLSLRCVMICLCVLALAAPSVLLPGGRSAVWILVDASDSMSGVFNEVTSRVQKGLQARGEGLDAGVIAFGTEAMVEVPLAEETQYSGVKTAVDGQSSNLSDALALAGALLPSDASGRIVVLSDGQTDDVSAEAAMLRQRGIPVDAYEVTAPQTADAQVTAVTLPSSVYQGQAFTVTVQLDATQDMTGTLLLYQNRAVVSAREVTLRKGENIFSFRDTAQETGVMTYEALLMAQDDGVSANDSMGAYICVEGAPHVLLVEGKSGEGSEMQKMLLAGGMQCETVLPAQLPADAQQLRQYDGVVLVNVDYDAATEAQWQALESAVRVLGRGLTVIGGDSSYALGGYRGTLLEDMLPVTIDVRNKMDLPALGLMLVIDASGSMSSGMFGTTRMELAKEAAMRATEVLTQYDQVGVIAFDDAAKWVVRLQKAEDIAGIQEMIGTLRPDGGTAFYTALREATYALAGADTQQKHIIFLTDGQAADSGYEPLCDVMRENGITLTTVAVGSGADQTLLKTLAERGGGRAFTADEFSNLPKIFTKETYLVSGSYVQNRTFTPKVTEQSVLTDFDGFPYLDGYLASMEKPLATVSLVSDREDPILAWWQYGAGRVVCFTSDSRGAWTQDFLAWTDAVAFYGGMTAFSLPAEERSGELTAQKSGNQLKVEYRTAAEQSGLETRMTALLPDGTQTALVLEETAQGVYEGVMDAAQEGAYALHVTQYDAEGNLLGGMEGGVVASYSREYDLRARDGSTLKELTARTGGDMLTAEDTLLRAGNAPVRARRDLTQGLLWTLMVLLMVDIALRRLNWDVALETHLQQRRREKAPAVREKPKRTDKKPRKHEAAMESAGDTAQQLLTRKQNRKIL